MLKIGELMTKVDNLISVTNKETEKLDALRHQVSFVKGALWVIGGLIAVMALAATWYFSGKLSITLNPGG
jgi:hypothetical protein